MDGEEKDWRNWLQVVCSEDRDPNGQIRSGITHPRLSERSGNFGRLCSGIGKKRVVILSIDAFGHGKTTISMRNRGYVNHKVTVNFGLDSEKTARL